MKKKTKKWLYLGIVAILVLVMAYFAFKDNIMGATFFSQALAVIGPNETAYAGDTFEHTFTLTNRDTEALPLSTSTRVVRLYKGYRMTDPAGTIVTTGCDTPDGSCDYVEEVTTVLEPGDTTTMSLVFTVTASTPSSFEGNPYGVSAMLFKVEQVWSRETNQWSETPSIIDSVEQNSELAKKFDVKTQTPPPNPTVDTIMQWFANLFASIWNFIKNLFGW